MTARFGPFTLDSERRQLTHDAAGEIHLTPRAFDLLVLLVAEAPRVVRKSELHDRVWAGTFVSDATVVGVVKEIRRALDDRDRHAPLVRTAHGVGYAFAGAVDMRESHASAVSRWVVAGARRISLSEGENLIGRDPVATVCLDAPGISRRHARIVVVNGEALLEDLESKNGTTVGDVAVTAKVALHDGDCIKMGDVLLIYHASASGVSTQTIARQR